MGLREWDVAKRMSHLGHGRADPSGAAMSSAIQSRQCAGGVACFGRGVGPRLQQKAQRHDRRSHPLPGATTPGEGLAPTHPFRQAHRPEAGAQNEGSMGHPRPPRTAARRARVGAVQHGDRRAKLRGCDLVRLKVGDVAAGGEVKNRAIIVQKKTGTPVQFEITEQGAPWAS